MRTLLSDLACDFLRDLSAAGGSVSMKNDAQTLIRDEWRALAEVAKSG
jgi:hypothetical protein